MAKIWRRGRLVAIVSAVTVLVVLFVWGIIAIEPFKHEASSFDVLSCDTGASSGPDDQGLTSRWDNDDLMIDAKVCSNCADSVESVTAQVIGPLVLVAAKISAPSSGIRTGCNCAHATQLRLSGLSRREYRIVRTWIEPFCP